MRIKSRVRQQLLSALESIEGKVQKLHYFLLENAEEKMDYTSLSPIANGDENGKYGQALLWALKNRKKKDIKNIALTGPYGSGKSSILKTFQDKYLGNDLKFLNISLATFKDEKVKKDANGEIIEPDKSELLRLIELSILQQIFYFEEDNKIPDSRFKKIKSFGRSRLLLYTFGYSLFVLSLLVIFFPYLIQGSFKDFPFSDTLCDIIFYASRSVVVLGVFGLIYKSIRVINAITFNKVTIQDAEFGLGDNINKSILNHNIDEILYFFGVRPYNVVIIEDLDRFQETEIFTKLREINLLLNSSKKTKRKEIVFVYAVRDEMFSDKDRTKFFDFIIPVIPIINSSNSSNILLDKRKTFDYTLSDSFIEDIGYYIDDMRLLHNINNEFYLYKEKLDDKLIQDKLFAIIVYKNIHPNDFVKLSYNSGELYEILTQKSKYINTRLEKLDEEIGTCREEIKKLGNVFLTDVAELRAVYLLKALEGIIRFDSFLVAGRETSFTEMTEEANFEYLKKDKLEYNERSYDYYNRGEKQTAKALGKTFADIQNKVNSKSDFATREKLLRDIETDKINILKTRIQEYEKQKGEIRKFSLSQLVLDGVDLGISEKSCLNPDFVDMALRNSYIAEDYMDYISLFHEGSLTRADYQFKINIRNRSFSDFDYKLNKIDKLIIQINPLDFESHFVLNYNLIDFVLNKINEYEKEVIAIFNLLKDGSEVSLKFIKGFLKEGVAVPAFLDLLCSYWPGFWIYIEDYGDFTREQQDEILVLLIDAVDAGTIKTLLPNSALQRKLEQDIDLLASVADDEKLKSVIAKLDLKFSRLQFASFSDEISDFIYENDHYQINIEMITQVIHLYGKWDQVAFDTSNYKAIMTSGCDKLIHYLTDYVDDYVTQVYTAIETNRAEEEPFYVELLKSEYLAHEYAIKIVDQVDTKLSSIAELAEPDLVSHFFTNNKVKADWENMLYLFEISEGVFTKEIVQFINILDNAKELSLKKMPLKVEEKNIFGKFCKAMLNSNDITDEAYEYISRSSPWWYKDLTIDELSVAKVRSLVNNRDIEPLKINFEKLKEHHSGLNIRLLELHKRVFMEILDDLFFDAEDVQLALTSSLLTGPEKVRIVGRCEESEIIANREAMVNLSQMLLDDRSLGMSESLKMQLVKSHWVSQLNRINLFLILNIGDHEFINTFLENLGDEYAKINDTSKRPSFVDHPSVKEFLERLVRYKYISSISLKKGALKVYHKLK